MVNRSPLLILRNISNLLLSEYYEKIISYYSASALSACVTQSSLQKDTAFKLGVDASQVQISNFNNGVVEGTYNADVAGKKYNCKVVGGVISAGVTDVECWPQVSSGKKVK